MATSTSERDTLKVLSRLFEERKADGFILPRTMVKDARVGLLRNLEVPHILYGRTGYGQPNTWEETSWFDIAGETAMRKAVLRLAGFGHTRIGYVGSDPKFNYSHLRRDGYTDGLAAGPAAYDPGSDPGRRQDAGGRRRAGDGPDAAGTAADGIVFATDLAALGFYAAAAGFGAGDRPRCVGHRL